MSTASDKRRGWTTSKYSALSALVSFLSKACSRIDKYKPIYRWLCKAASRSISESTRLTDSKVGLYVVMVLVLVLV
jgi:hypothetical protein